MSIKKTSPKGGKRGCLCDDGKTYSKDCCKGKDINQGIGALIQQGVSEVVNTNEPRVIVNTSN